MKYTYEAYYKSKRPDGRIVSSHAALLEQMRRHRPLLSTPKDPTREQVLAWQSDVRQKAVEVLNMPEFTEQPAPVLLSCTQRTGYRVERWEFYPDDVSAVPVLMLIPDCADAAHPAPTVFCFTGSNHNKEFIADEPPIGLAGQIDRYPDRNRMGRYYAENGMIAVCFDPLGISELSLDTEDPNKGWHSRTAYTHGLLMEGYNYVGVSARNALCFLDFVKTLPFVDAQRIAVSGHSLGTEVTIFLAMVTDDFRAIVFNDMCASTRDRYAATTEHEDLADPAREAKNFHLVPGMTRYFDLKDLCAAAAPRALAMNEGGPDEYLNDIRAVYAALGAQDQLQITHYPKYQDPAARTFHGDMPLYGLSEETHYLYSNTDAPDHSFRKEPSLTLLKKVFFGE